MKSIVFIGLFLTASCGQQPAGSIKMARVAVKSAKAIKSLKQKIVAGTAKAKDLDETIAKMVAERKPEPVDTALQRMYDKVDVYSAPEPVAEEKVIDELIGEIVSDSAIRQKYVDKDEIETLVSASVEKVLDETVRPVLDKRAVAEIKDQDVVASLKAAKALL